MILPRVIPCLLLKEDGLVKTTKFKSSAYVGDPINSVRIFNEYEVDELVFLDITASLENKAPNFELLSEIAEECFMPLAYGGGIKTIEDAHRILSIGLEKVIVNSEAHKNPDFITKLSERFGSSSVVCSIDVKKNLFGKYELYSHVNGKRHKDSLVEWVKKVEDKGAGEILLTSVDKEGTWKGYDTDLIELVSSQVNVPVVASGGSASLGDVRQAIISGASAAALGNMVVYQGEGLGVLVSYPDRNDIEKTLLNL